MKIKMLVPFAGTQACLSAGDTHDPDQAEAIRLITAGYALPVDKAEYDKAVKSPAIETR